MSEDGVLGRVLAILDHAQIAYMLTGSFASSFHGAPRATQDIDLVIDPDADQLDALVAQLAPAQYYVDPQAAREALAERGQFNVVDLETGWKIDLIIRKDRPFSREEFGRRRRVTLMGVEVFAATLEDLILAKLERAKLGQSERQLRDVAGMVAASGRLLDRGYLEHWVSVLEVEPLWSRALELLEGGDPR